LDEENPMDWLENSMSEANPVLDGGDHPSQFAVDEIIKMDGCLNRKQWKFAANKTKVRRVSSLTKITGYKKGKKALLNEDDEFADTSSELILGMGFNLEKKSEEERSGIEKKE
jgi:hypothetical protein